MLLDSYLGKVIWITTPWNWTLELHLKIFTTARHLLVQDYLQPVQSLFVSHEDKAFDGFIQYARKCVIPQDSLEIWTLLRDVLHCQSILYTLVILIYFYLPCRIWYYKFSMDKKIRELHSCVIDLYDTGRSIIDVASCSWIESWTHPRLLNCPSLSNSHGSAIPMTRL